MIGSCGLNCSCCDAFVATIEDNDEKRKDTAVKWSKMYNTDIKPEQINCTGCSSDKEKFFHCNVCEIRKCCISNDIKNCSECEKYICDTLADFIKIAPEAGAALENLRK